MRRREIAPHKGKTRSELCPGPGLAYFNCLWKFAIPVILPPPLFLKGSLQGGIGSFRSVFLPIHVGPGST